MLEQMLRMLDIRKLLLMERMLVSPAASFPLPKLSNSTHYLGDMHENDYRNHQAFQA